MANYKKYVEEFEEFFNNYRIDMERDLQSFNDAAISDDWHKVTQARELFEKRICSDASEIQGALFYLHCMAYVKEDYFFEKQEIIGKWKWEHIEKLYDIVDKKFDVWKVMQSVKLTESATC